MVNKQHLQPERIAHLNESIQTQQMLLLAAKAS